MPMKNDEALIQEKLVDAFSHQHKDLKSLCEFIVDISVKNVSMTTSQVCIYPLSEESLGNYCVDYAVVFPVDLDWYLNVLIARGQNTALAAVMIMYRKVSG